MGHDKLGQPLSANLKDRRPIHPLLSGPIDLAQSMWGNMSNNLSDNLWSPLWNRLAGTLAASLRDNDSPESSLHVDLSSEGSK